MMTVVVRDGGRVMTVAVRDGGGVDDSEGWREG